MLILSRNLAITNITLVKLINCLIDKLVVIFLKMKLLNSYTGLHFLYTWNDIIPFFFNYLTNDLSASLAFPVWCKTPIEKVVSNVSLGKGKLKISP